MCPHALLSQAQSLMVINDEDHQGEISHTEVNAPISQYLISHQSITTL